MDHLLVLLATFAFCVGSAIIPVLHAETYLVTASLIAPQELRWPLVIAATSGQMLGKVGMYYAGRGVTLIPGERMQRRIRLATARYRQKHRGRHAHIPTHAVHHPRLRGSLDPVRGGRLPPSLANGSNGCLSVGEQLPNKRLKLAARVDWGMNLSSARRSLSAVR